MLKKITFIILLPPMLLLYGVIALTHGYHKDDIGWFQKIWDTPFWPIGLIVYPVIRPLVWFVDKVYPWWEKLLND